MNEYFELELVSLDKHQKIIVEWLSIEGGSGSFIIGKGHAPLISVMKKMGEMVYKTSSGEEVRKRVPGGIVKVDNDKVKILLD